MSVPGWSGAGYIILDPEPGAGAYKISGGANGSFFTGLAIGASTVAMITALFAAIPLGFTAVVGVFVLLFAALVPALLFAIAYATSVYSSDEEQMCMAIGTVTGAALTNIAATLYSGAAKIIEAIVKLIITGTLSNQMGKVSECFE
jgi:hypothetical protein